VHRRGWCAALALPEAPSAGPDPGAEAVDGTQACPRLPSLAADIPDRYRPGSKRGMREYVPWGTNLVQADDPVLAPAARAVSKNVLFCLIDT
jgi:hypothetical protein